MSRFITTLAVGAAVCLTTLVIHEWFRRDLSSTSRPYTDRNFATANLMMFVVGAVLFATTVMLPRFLQNPHGLHRAEGRDGAVGGALILLVEMPIVGRLTTIIQVRDLVAFGRALLAGTMSSEFLGGLSRLLETIRNANVRGCVHNPMRAPATSNDQAIRRRRSKPFRLPRKHPGIGPPAWFQPKTRAGYPIA